MSIPWTGNVNYPAHFMGFPGPGNLRFLPVVGLWWLCQHYSINNIMGTKTSSLIQHKVPISLYLANYIIPVCNDYTGIIIYIL